MNFRQITMGNFKKVFKESIILCLLVMVTILFSTYLFFNVFSSPSYTSSFQVLFNSNTTQGDTQQLEGYKTNIQLMSTVSSIIKSSKVMEEVKKKGEIDKSAKEISKKVNVISEANSLVLNVEYTSGNSKDVGFISKNLLEIIQVEIPTTFANSTITVLEKPDVPKKISLIPNYIMSVFVGLFICITFIILKSAIDNRIGNPDQFKQLGIVYLGDILLVKDRRKNL